MIDLKPGLLVGAALLTSSCGPELVREVPLKVTNLKADLEHQCTAELRPIDSGDLLVWPSDDVDIKVDSDWYEAKALSGIHREAVGIGIHPTYGKESILIDSLNVSFSVSKDYFNTHEISAAIKHFEDGSAEFALDLTEKRNK